MLNHEYEPMLTAIAASIGSLIALVLLRFCRASRKSRGAGRQVPQCYLRGIGVLVLTAWAYAFRQDGFALFMMAGGAAFNLVLAIRLFFKERPQFTLRSLFLLTLGVAMLCSTSYYVPIAPVILVAAIPLFVWLGLRGQ